MIHEVLGGNYVFLPILEKNMREVLEGESEGQIEEIDCMLEELQQEFLWLANVKKEYANVTNELLTYDKQLVQRLLEKIMVYEDTLVVEFKSGLEIEVKR